MKSGQHPLLKSLRARPRLAVATLVGLLIYATSSAASGMVALSATTRFLISWNAAVFLYLVLAGMMVARSSHQAMRDRAMEQDEGRITVLLLVVLSVFASLFAILDELSELKRLSPDVRLGHVILTLVTIILSWLFTHLMFALHYAHDFYLNQSRGRPTGLDFPGEAAPAYGDFLYLAGVIGTSAQTADVTLTSRAMRSLGLAHCVLSFFFNTAVLALSINIAAGMLQG